MYKLNRMKKLIILLVIVLTPVLMGAQNAFDAFENE